MMNNTTMYFMFRKVYNVGNLTDCYPAKQTLLATEYEITAKPDSLLHAFSLSLFLCLSCTHTFQKFKTDLNLKADVKTRLAPQIQGTFLKPTKV